MAGSGWRECPPSMAWLRSLGLTSGQQNALSAVIVWRFPHKDASPSCEALRPALAGIFFDVPSGQVLIAAEGISIVIAPGQSWSFIWWAGNGEGGLNARTCDEVPCDTSRYSEHPPEVGHNNSDRGPITSRAGLLSSGTDLT
jgi:hypothetical protein